MGARPKSIITSGICDEDYFSNMIKTDTKEFLSSGSSTESLVSILDHISQSHHSIDRSFSDESSIISDSRFEDGKVEGKFYEQAQNQSDYTKETNFGAWEKWLIDKTKRLRLEKKKKNFHNKEMLEQERKKEEEEIKKKYIIDVKIQNWINEKDTAAKKNKEETLLKQKLEEKEKAKQKEMILQKSKDNYEKWLTEKAIKEKELLSQELEKNKIDKLRKEEHYVKCQQAFIEWKKKADKKPKTFPNSFGYTSGNLTGYYDSNAYPIPGFFNPIPWQPIHVNTSKSKKSPHKGIKKSRNKKNIYGIHSAFM